MIQKQFENSTIEQKIFIFAKIYPEASSLVKDQFGNYVIQKFFEKGTNEQKVQLYQLLKGQVQDLSLHTYGCRVIQKALEELKDYPILQEAIIQELNDTIMDCIQDQHGNHVIQKCFEVINCSKLQVIIREVITNIRQLAFHPYGCRVIQRILEFCKTKETDLIYKKLMENLIDLCKCQYGNYIIQYIIEKGNNENKQNILKVIKQYFVSLSLNKFASNVTEKSILYSDDKYKHGVLEVLLSQYCVDNQEYFLFQIQFILYLIQVLELSNQLKMLLEIMLFKDFMKRRISIQSQNYVNTYCKRKIFIKILFQIATENMCQLILKKIELTIQDKISNFQFKINKVIIRKNIEFQKVQIHTFLCINKICLYD
ncbi:pumilio-family RNA binding repeat protein, partial [Ichthyophthirius multifiliis]